MITDKYNHSCEDGLGKVTLFAVALIGTLLGASVLMGEQSSTAGPQHFEVVSLKPRNATQAAAGGRGGGGGLTSCSAGFAQIDAKRFALNNTNLYTLITLAYRMGPCVFVHSARISAGPAWMASDHFDVQAVVPDGTPQYTSKQLDDGRAPELETMLQNMLADRFKLGIHKEMKEIPMGCSLHGGTGRTHRLIESIGHFDAMAPHVSGECSCKRPRMCA